MKFANENLKIAKYFEIQPRDLKEEIIESIKKAFAFEIKE